MYTSNKVNNQSNQSQNGTLNYSLSSSLQANVDLIKKIFNDVDTLVVRYFENQLDNNVKCCILFIDGMINNEITNENIIKPIIQSNFLVGQSGNIDSILNHVIFSNNASKTEYVDKIIEGIMNGDTVFFLEGAAAALVISTKGWNTRSITEPEGEKTIRGPREGFTESLIMNLTMIRRKLLTPDLKFKLRTIGVRSNTKVCLCYIEGIVNDKILNEVNKRLDTIDIDGILASEYIQEYIKDSPFSPFKTIGSTERPDIVAAKLLEGRIAILVDGTPVVLTVPYVFIEYFQSNEDYYVSFYFSSINRLLRILCFILSTSVPALFVGIVAFHQEMIPTPLAISISASRQNIPFPVVVEALGLLIVFEIIRETGIRMSTQASQAFTIVGALVIGEGAVNARFVSAPIVIIIALTGITGLTVPRMKGATILLRVLFLILTSILGLYGFTCGVIGLLIHLFQLRSFGVPYMLGLMTLNPQDIKDTAIRVPWFYMKYRPKFITSNNMMRKADGGKKK